MSNQKLQPCQENNSRPMWSLFQSVCRLCMPQLVTCWRHQLPLILPWWQVGPVRIHARRGVRIPRSSTRPKTELPKVKSSSSAFCTITSLVNMARTRTMAIWWLPSHSNKIVWILQWILSMILSNPCNIHELHFLRQNPRWSIFGNNIPAISTESSTLCNIHINFYKNEKCMRNHAISTAISTLAVGWNDSIL